MSTGNTGGPAFPTARVNINGVDEQDGIQSFGSGMTLRDYFAAKAMQACIAHGDGAVYPNIAEWSYCMADAMLEARES